MNQQEREDFEELTKKLAMAGKILNSALNGPRQIGVVSAGPLEDGITYRIDMDGNSIIAGFYDLPKGTDSGQDEVTAADINFNKQKKKSHLKVGTEVVMINGLIVEVLPMKLKKIEATALQTLVTWDQVGGLKSQIHRIRESIELPMKHAELAREIGLSPIKGALLYGPPGCGKTLIAKAIASTVLKSKDVDKRAFVYGKGGEMLRPLVGLAEMNIVALFRGCREYTRETGQRAVLFIDEAEAIMPRRGSRVSSDVENTIVPTFLAEMDGFESDGPFVLLATNHPNQIDSAVLREGRIDLHIEINRPTEKDVEEIFLIHLDAVKCAQASSVLAKVGTESIFGHAAKERVSGSLVETVVRLSAQKALSRKVADKHSRTGLIAEDVKAAVGLLSN